MGMRAMEDMRELLCKEFEEIAQKGELNVGDLDIIHKLTDTIKNIDKIEMFEESGGYSRAAEWEGGIRGHSYDEGGSSYGGGYSGRHYVRGHYSREGGGGGGYSGRRGYSRDDGREQMMQEMEQLMQQAEGRQREIIKRAMEELKKA